jgi:hypothetical protein
MPAYATPRLFSHDDAAHELQFSRLIKEVFPMAARISSNPPASPQQHERHSPNIENDIRQRAYELYEQRGREDGKDIDDWLHAEERDQAQAYQERGGVAVRKRR